MFVCARVRVRTHTPPHSFKGLKMKSLYVDPTSDGCPPKENKDGGQHAEELPQDQEQELGGEGRSLGQ